jgi:predicted RNA-binding Zn ribbon-like protein
VSDGNQVALPTAGRDPGGRTPAPGSLRLVQALVNTLNAESGKDLLGTAADAVSWLQSAGLLPAGGQLTGAEHEAVLAVREAIRGVLLAHTHQETDAESAGRLTMVLRSIRLGLDVDPLGGVRLVSADHEPYARVIGAVAIAIAEAGSNWARLKSCPGHHCGWAFYDRSASGGSRWCSMQLCGARSKMRAYRERQPT